MQHWTLWGMECNELFAEHFHGPVIFGYDHESDRRLLPDQARRPRLETFEHDANSERRLPRAQRKRDSRSQALAVPASKRQYAPQARQKPRSSISSWQGSGPYSRRRRGRSQCLSTAGFSSAPSSLRQVFNDTESEVLWLIVGPPEAEFGPRPGAGLELDFTRLTPNNCPRNWRAASGPPKDGTPRP